MVMSKIMDLCFTNLDIIIISSIIYLTLTEVNIFTVKNIYIAVAIPLNNKDCMLIKVNEKRNLRKQNTTVREIN